MTRRDGHPRAKDQRSNNDETMSDTATSDTEQTDDQDDRVRHELTRRTLLAAIGIAGAGASGYFAGTARAAPTGTFPESNDDPLLKLRADRLRLIPRQSDPGSPDNGTMWYNDSA